MVRKLLLSLIVTAACAMAEEYSVAAGGAPPAGIAASVSGLLEQKGVKILKDGQPLAEIWYRTSLPKGAPSGENNLSLPAMPHGSLIAVVRFDAKHEDRRGQGIQPGVYTMRYSYFPENGTHQGAAPQRDFLLLVPAAGDTDGAQTPNFEQLLTLSRKASGTPHPAVFSVWKEDPKYFKAGALEKQGEHDWVIMHTIGGVAVSLIIAGKAEA